MSEAVALPTETQPSTDYIEQQPENKPTVPGLLIGVLVHPRPTFKSLREMKKGYWWLVFLMTVAVLILYTMASASVTSRAMQSFALPSGAAAGNTTTNTNAAGTVPPGGNAAADTPQVAQTSLSFITVVVPLALGIITILIGYAFRGLVAFGASLIMGGNSTFRQTFRMAVWTTIPSVFRYLVQSIAVVATQGRIVSGLTGVMTTLESRDLPVLNLLLGPIDFYMIWSMVLLGIGVTVTTKLSKGKSIVAVLIYVVISAAGFLLYYVIGNALGGLAGGNLRIPGVGGGFRGRGG